MAYGYYPSFYPRMEASQPIQNGIIWVQGEAGAKSYLVAPNSTIQLWDSEAHTIYLKSADASGMPSMKILDYTIRGNSPETSQNGREAIKNDLGYIYATKDDLMALRAEFETLKQSITNGGVKNEHNTTVPAIQE